MSEWWTYRLSDFLLFSPRTYYRLFELYNRELWPLHLVAVAASIAILVAVTRGRSAAAGRAVAAILAILWLWVGWAFLFERYQPINWAAKWLAAGFAAQALLFMIAALVRDRLGVTRAAGAPRRVGLALFLFALLVQPLVGPLAGRSWREIEMFAMTPDPTVAGSMGLLLLMANGKMRIALLVIPMLWCAVSGATLWTLDAPDALLLPAIAVITIVAAWVGGRNRP